MSHAAYVELAPKVERIAKKFFRTFNSRRIGTYEDVLQEAYRGLGEALERFDPNHPQVNRDGYLMKSVTLHLKKRSCELGLIKIPTYLMGVINSLRRPSCAKLAHRANNNKTLTKLTHELSSPEEVNVSLEVRDAVENLTGVQKEIIKRRFGLIGNPLTLIEVAKELGIGRSTVIRIEMKAIEKLRTLLV